MNSLKVPPHSEEAEKSVLGAILLDSEAIVKVAEFLRSEHFYDPSHRSIFAAELSLYEDRSPIDLVTVSDKLKKLKQLAEVGGSDYLAKLVGGVPTAANIVSYAKLVRDCFTKRELVRLSGEMSTSALDESREVVEILDEAEQKLFSLSQQQMRQGFISVKDALAESFDRLDEIQRAGSGLRGVATGYKELDAALAGLQKSNLVVLAARPGIGKTTLALNIAQYAAVTSKVPVGYFALEMSQEEMVDRMLVAQADIDAWKFKIGKFKDEDFNRLSEAFGILADAPFYIDDTPALSIMEMRTKARRLKSEHQVGLLIVDYLQLARSRNLENRVQEVSEISQGLKNLARELKVPILALSQLSRAVEHRERKRPQLADLRECLTGDTLILMADTGELCKIKNLVGKSGFKVFSLSADNKLIVSKVRAAVNSGQKKIYSLSTQSGRTIRCSLNHPFYTLNGWQKLEKIEAGEYIAVMHKAKKTTWEEFVELKISGFLNDPEIWNLADSGIYWDKISAVRSEGTEDVYDLQVEGAHNFVANDIFVHNSGAIEQDADVVMFLYREDDENQENLVLDIQKHRNGPLRRINLFFRGDRIRFYGVERGAERGEAKPKQAREKDKD